MIEDRLNCILEKINNYGKINSDILNKTELINKSIEGDKSVFVPPTFRANVDMNKTVYKCLCEEATQMQLSVIQFKDFLESCKSVISDEIEAQHLSKEVAKKFK